MGNKPAIIEVQTSPIISAMKDKYPGSTDCVDIWCALGGFPKGGSLNWNDLKKLRNWLEEKEKELKCGKKVSVKRLLEFEKHKECLLMWENEEKHDWRIRRKAAKALTTLPATSKGDLLTETAFRPMPNKLVSAGSCIV